MNKWLRLGVIIVINLWMINPLLAGVVIIVHPDVADQQLSRQDIKNIFLGKKNKWSDGQPITFAVMNSPVAYHEDFVKDFVEKNSNQFQLYWKKAVFTGTGSAPQAFEDPSATINFIASTKGSISYIDDNLKDTKVRVMPVQ